MRLEEQYEVYREGWTADCIAASVRPDVRWCTYQAWGHTKAQAVFEIRQHIRKVHGLKVKSKTQEEK